MFLKYQSNEYQNFADITLWPWWDNERIGGSASPAFDSEHNNCNIEFWNDVLNCEFIVTKDIFHLSVIDEFLTLF